MNKGKKITSLFLIFSLLVLSGNLFAKKKGAELIVQKKDGQQVRGELIVVKESSLLLLDAKGADVSIDIQDIDVITVVRKSKALLGAGIGLLMGGSIAAQSVKEKQQLEDMRSRFTIMIGMPIIFTLLGALVGRGMGADEIIQIEGKSPEEVKEALEKLRKKARIPDYM